MRKLINTEYCDKCGFIKEQCECEKTKTNADRIRSMSDEELADFLKDVKADYQWSNPDYPSEDDYGSWLEWLLSEVEG